MNASFKAVNLLIDRNIAVIRIDVEGSGFRPGDFIVSRGPKVFLHDVAEQTGVEFKALDNKPEQGVHPVKRMRTGMYQRYRGGNMDEGWTRFLLETFSFPYTSLKDVEIKKGKLIDSYDVIILPDDSPEMIIGEAAQSSQRSMSSTPPEYRSGIGQDGVEALREFVQNGGTLVTFGEACGFAIDRFSLRVRNVVENIDSKDFFCPGSTLRAIFDNTHPLAYGMPSEGVVLYRSSPVFVIVSGERNEDYATVVRYKDKDLLRSGWLIGEEHLSSKPAMVTAKYGKGQIVLIGFRTQHRSQTHGTFKLLFNTLIR
jgi:hypothetical protein